MRQSIESDSVKLGGALFRQRLLCLHHLRWEHLGLCGELGTVQHKVRKTLRVDAPGLKTFTFLWTFFFGDEETGGTHITQRISLTCPNLISAVRQHLRPRGVCFCSKSRPLFQQWGCRGARGRDGEHHSLTVLLRQADWDTKGFLDAVQGVLNLDGRQLRDDELAPVRHLHAEFVFLRSLSRW